MLPQVGPAPQTQLPPGHSESAAQIVPAFVPWMQMHTGVLVGVGVGVRVAVAVAVGVAVIVGVAVVVAVAVTHHGRAAAPVVPTPPTQPRGP